MSQFGPNTKLRELGRFVPQVFSASFPRQVVSWYHKKYVLTNRINPFVHVFVALSAFGWYLHESRHGHHTQYKHH